MPVSSLERTPCGRSCYPGDSTAPISVIRVKAENNLAAGVPLGFEGVIQVERGHAELKALLEDWMTAYLEYGELPGRTGG